MIFRMFRTIFWDKLASADNTRTRKSGSRHISHATNNAASVDFPLALKA